MSAESSFYRAVHPLLELLVQGKEDAVLAAESDPAIEDRIEYLADRCTEGELTEEERKEYEGFVRANNFWAIVRRTAKARKATEAL